MTYDAIIRIINNQYPFEIKSIIEGPRQFVAQTFVIEIKNGEKYFVKCTNKVSFISEIILGLPALHELHGLGIDFINYPIKTNSGEYYVMDSQSLIVLYNYIPASQSYEYDLKTFGELTAVIHYITPKVQSRVPIEDFKYKFATTLENALVLQTKSSKLNNLISDYSMMLQHYYKIFEEIYETQQQTNHEGQLVITNGDAPGNVLVRSKTDIYIIDWDELKLATPERDLWFLDHETEFMKGYRKIFPNYEINKLNKYFCVLNYFFNSCAQYINEIELDLNEDYSNKHIEGLSGFLDRKSSWISKYLEDIDQFASSFL